MRSGTLTSLPIFAENIHPPAPKDSVHKEILKLFPSQSHDLILVSDRDGLLTDEVLLADLGERGFTVLTESDPVLLRHRVEGLKPWRAEAPVILVTRGTLEALPYDLWGSGHHVRLSLHDYFPNLAYPLVQALTPYQRARLSETAPPPSRLGQGLSAEYLLRHVFRVPLEHLGRPGALVGWLDEYHNGLAPLPPALLDDLLVRLGRQSGYAAWPLRELIESRAAFGEFMQNQWTGYVDRSLGEWGAAGPYRLNPVPASFLPFGQDAGLQDALPRLVRTGTLAPLEVRRLSAAPSWAMPALLASESDRRPQRRAELSAALQERLNALSGTARWEDWGPIAWLWAELSLLRAEAPDLQPASGLMNLRLRLDSAFTAWLQQSYTPLGTQRLPVPHHVHHVPHYLNYRREQGEERIALLVLDGLAIMDWLLIREAWAVRHPSWRMTESLVLAQIPTITSISRQALVSGLRPADFAASIDSNREEPRQWSAFWSRAGVPAAACGYVPVDFRHDLLPAALGDPRLRLLCIVERTLDEIVHGSVLGNADLVSTVRVWLDANKNDQYLEEALSDLLERGFAVFITGDHGHTEANGVGLPNQGILAGTRGRRVRIYSDPNLARQTQTAFQPSLLWENDGLLPDDIHAVLPDGRGAFAPVGEPILTHGGASIDEVVVPFIEISHG